MAATRTSKQPPVGSTLDSDLRYVKGVGPRRAEALLKLGIQNLHDLLFFFPRRYEDRSQFTEISKLQPGETASVCGEVLKCSVRPLKRMAIVEAIVGDDSAAIHAVWFNQRYLKDQFRAGRKVILYGKAEWYQNRIQMNAPEYEFAEGDEKTVHTGIITPIYPLTEGLFQRSLRKVMTDSVASHLDRTVEDYFPDEFRAQHDLDELRESVRQMHFPTEFDRLARARRRIVFDEFLVFQLVLLERFERMRERHRALALTGVEVSLADFKAKLPFEFTAGQSQAAAEILADLALAAPMNRLLQGDVGAGKTVVAALALFAAVRSGFQGVMLVPTEILAEQHHRSLHRLLQPLGIEVARLTAGTPAPAREKLLAELKQNKVHVLVGTHAVLQEDVRFKALAVAVIDEQHKFGVQQRGRLFELDPRPHQLLMTATPIPRTLALTIYGDLKISTMRDLPAGRKPIKTFWITRSRQAEVLEHIREKLAKGEQAYFVFPMIEETEKIDLKAAESEFLKLKQEIFKEFKVGMVHGRMNRDERDWMMREFRDGKLQVLVATSVVEVGVDHPNATLMVVENAERFGLAQLHQLRGRIGRGHLPSECFLFGEPETEEGKRRLRIMTKTQDGFLIAEEDLKLRGPGDFMGTRQSGDPYFKVGHPLLDEPILIEARQAARKILNQRLLEKPEWSRFKSYLEKIAIQY